VTLDYTSGPNSRPRSEPWQPSTHGWLMNSHGASPAPCLKTWSRCGGTSSRALRMWCGRSSRGSGIVNLSGAAIAKNVAAAVLTAHRQRRSRQDQVHRPGRTRRRARNDEAVDCACALNSLVAAEEGRAGKLGACGEVRSPACRRGGAQNPPGNRHCATLSVARAAPIAPTITAA